MRSTNLLTMEKLGTNLSYEKQSFANYRLFCHICSKASASSMLVISSESWNFKKPFPPCPCKKSQKDQIDTFFNVNGIYPDVNIYLTHGNF